MTPTEIEIAPADAPQEKRGVGRLLLGIVLWPRSTFGYLRDQGGRSWLWPVLLVALLAVAARVVAAPIEKARADAALAAIEAQQNASGQGATGKGTLFISGSPGGLPVAVGPGGPGSNPLLDYGLPVVGVGWDWLFRGAALLGLAWLLGGRPAPGAMFRMSGWTLVPSGARLLVALAVMLVAHREPIAGLQGLGAAPANVTINVGPSETQSGGNQSLQAGPNGAGSPSGPSYTGLLWSAFLGALDLYNLWALLLMLVGVAVTARLGWLKAAISTLLYWGVSLALAAVPPLLSFLLLTLARPGNVVGP
jgi:hypothetical protein